MSNFLRREADSFFFRRRVPASLQARLGQSEIYRSLKTTVRRTARARAAHLFIATESLFRTLEEDDEFPFTDDDIRVAVRRWLNTPPWKQRLKIVDEMSPGGLRAYHESLPDTLLKMSADEGVSYGDNLGQEANAALDHSEYFDVRSGDRLRRTARALQDQLREYVDRQMEAVFGQEPVAVATMQTVAAVTPPEPPANMTKLSTFIQSWQKDIIAGYNYNDPLKDADQYLKTVEMFISLMDDLPVGRITFEKAAEFRELILQLPSTHGKGGTASPKKELARARADKTLPRVSMKTAKRHFSGMNSIWKWLIHRKHVPATLQPFSGHSFPGTKQKKSARNDWSREDMQRLFTSREYRDASGSSALHWLPLISLYSGMRLEEICRLRPGTDILVKDGMPCFDITARQDWDPKSEAGRRVIPIHSWLLKHGIMDFVKAQRARGAEHLFSPELPFGKSISASFSRDFSRLKIDLGVGSKTVFHSFRHTFRTILESTDLKESHIDAVMGHEGGGSEGRTYTKRVSTAKLKEVVEAFEPPLDLAFLGTASADTPLPLPKIAVKKRKLTPPVLDANGRIHRGRK
ncbi:site-specific integrase [Agrobacterium tumefaciens]|uniref:site-specific integrase n=1 Tax=Agrobacterium tumefaciens TaxID=358 RepID=UPI001572E7AB|nr:site-specific integrase [Agrobacterium tumefaciens]NSZ85219.1 tyrosine-type recombinase/integrase [Agrobacterium tumefaciens]WCA70469.1 site-specific integrase [Agrobacterium tumefaciens]